MLEFLFVKLIRNPLVWLDVRINTKAYKEAMKRSGFISVDTLRPKDVWRVYRA